MKRTKSRSHKQTDKAVLALAFLAMAFPAAWAAVPTVASTPTGVHQQQTIRGVVLDETGAPLPSANVSVASLKLQTLTNDKGEFNLRVPRVPVVLRVSYVGYEPQEITVTQPDQPLRVELKSRAELGEVVIVGYGTSTKRDLIASVSTVKTEQLTNIPTANIAQGLAGRSPGMIVKASGGGINSMPNISIRGGGKPLYVIDGVIRSEQDFANLSADDIENMSILKDASATAVYGARATNGIVQVSTKRGRQGTATVEYDFNYSVAQPGIWPEQLPSYVRAEYGNLARKNDGLGEAYSAEAIKAMKDGSQPQTYNNTNWRKLVLNDWAPQSKHTVRIMGGNDMHRFYASLGHIDQNSLYKHNNHYMKRTNFRLAESAKLKAIDLEVNATIDGYVQINTHPYSSTASGYYHVFSHINDKSPLIPGVNAFGLPFNLNDNPVAETAPDNGYNRNNQNVVNGKGELIWGVYGVKGLKLRLASNYRYFGNTTKQWRKDAANVATELGVSASSDFGSNRFSLLRKCNLIIEKAEKSASLSGAEKKTLIAQGRFLRGMVFFDQARKIGRFVPVMQVFNEKDDEASKLPMTKTPEESYEFVLADLEFAAKNLPLTTSAGIANKYAAQVIVSRAALQAYAYTGNAAYLDKAIQAANEVVTNCKLSPAYAGMFNANDSRNPEILLGYYRLSTNTTVGSYSEMIRVFPNITPGDTELSLSPHPLENKSGDQTFCCWCIYFPTQDMVDQYLVTDEETGAALPWYETSQYKKNVEELDPKTITTAGQVDAYERKNGEKRRIPTPQDLLNVKTSYPHFARYAKVKSESQRTISDLMYSGRDKRFAASIVYDGATWLNEKIETNLGGNLSQGVRDKEDGGWYNTVTGYYWRKGSTETPNPRAFHTSPTDFHFTLARVGEAYMNLAEAHLLKGNVTEAVKALNATRTTHGGLAPSAASTPETAWADYIRERRVEMANEGGDIYFSYLRWGKYGGPANYDRPAGEVIYDLDAPPYKVSISRDRKQVLVGQMTLLNSASRLFTPKRYLFPIAKGFLDTREAYGIKDAQNEGW